MLYLRTGLPGAGKTLNAIREIDIEHQPDPNEPDKRLHKDPDHPDLPPRTIYYYGIPELKADRLKSNWVEFDHPDRWFDLPDGSVIVIDEAQRIFGNDGSRARPDKITRFETHRHQGLDIHLITQHPSLLATAVRKLVGKHINFIRPYGREKGIFRHEYEFCIDAPEKRVNFKQAQEERVTLDPDYFGTYKSSTIHTHKPVKPNYLKKLPILIGLTSIPILVLVFMFGLIIKRGTDNMDELNASKPTHVASSQVVPGGATSSQPGTAVQVSAETQEDEYIMSLKPRIEGVPHSAPRYDAVAKPLDFPRLICASSTDPAVIDRNRSRGHPIGLDPSGNEFSCTCYTQQVTRVETDPQFCRDVVNNGIFDDTRRPPVYANQSGTLTTAPMEPTSSGDFSLRGPAAVKYPPQPVQPSSVTIVANNELPNRPWR